MGTNSSLSNQKQFVKIYHPRFTQAQLCCLPLQLQITVHYTKYSDITKWQHEYKRINEQQSLLLPVSFHIQREMICSEQGLCQIRFENYSNILKEQIKERSGEVGLAFKNEEIWYIVLTLLQAVHIFHSKNKKLGDIRPVNIFINSDGKMKVANQYSFPNQLTNYDKSLLEKEPTYLAPEELSSLMFSKPSKVDVQLAETFSIGLTLMDVILLTNSEDIYDFLSFKINFDLLNDRKQKISCQEGLDPVLKTIVLGFLQVQSSYRVRCCQVYERLKHYESSVLSFKPFCIVDWPWIKSEILIERNNFINRSKYSSSESVQPQTVKIKYRESTIVKTFKPNAEPLFSNFRQSQNSKEDKFNNNSVLYQTKTFEKTSQKQLNSTIINKNNVNSDQKDFSSTLKRIDEQLQKSRYFFPS